MELTRALDFELRKGTGFEKYWEPATHKWHISKHLSSQARQRRNSVKKVQKT
jgi:hypothetical protein